MSVSSAAWLHFLHLSEIPCYSLSTRALTIIVSTVRNFKLVSEVNEGKEMVKNKLSETISLSSNLKVVQAGCTDCMHFLYRLLNQLI